MTPSDQESAPPGGDARAAPQDGGERVSRPEQPRLAPGELSALLGEVARIPERKLRKAWARTPRVGSVVARRFELRRELGRGGFGVVYEAFDRQLKRLVALKCIRVEARGATQSLQREADAIARLEHPNIVILHDKGMAGRSPFLIMELLRGETLRDRTVHGPILAPEVVGIANEVARALAYAHAAGVVHRDLKPSNVFLTDEGGVKVLDFGLAHIFGGSSMQAGGTPAYMAPEQWSGDTVDPRTDVYSLGVMLFEMLTGELPFPTRAGGEPPPGPPPVLRPDVASSELSALVTRALSTDPGGRPRDGREMFDSLRALEAGLQRAPFLGPANRTWGLAQAAAPPQRQAPSLPPPPSRPPTVAASRRGRARRWLSLASVPVVLAVGVFLYVKVIAPGQVAPIRVVVADFENATGEEDLDGLSGLLITSLEQSRHLSVPPRSLLLGVLGREVERIDEPVGRDLARSVRAKALLLPAIRRFGQTYTVSVRAVDPEANEDLFARKEHGTSKDGIPGMIDRISDATRKNLREQEADILSSKVELAKAVTRSLEAYEHYQRGQECMGRTAYGQDCSVELEKALAADSTFALAHYLLAVWRSSRGGTRAEQMQAMDAAVQHIARVPAKERILILAWKAHLDGKDGEALALYQAMIDGNPEYKQPLWEKGDLLFHRGDYAAVVPVFEKLLQIDRSHAWGLDHLVDALGALGRRAKLQILTAELARAPPNMATLHALSAAYGWLGDYPAAAAAARHEEDVGGPLEGQEDLAYVALLAGDYGALVPPMRAAAEAGGTTAVFGRLALAAIDAYRGRRHDGLRWLDELFRPEDGARSDTLVHAFRADYLTGGDAAGPVWEEARTLMALDPAVAAAQAVNLAYLNDLPRAAQMARQLTPGSAREQVYQALVRWRGGENAVALDLVRDVAQKTPYFDTPFVIAPAYLRGEIAADAGEDREAVEALQEFQSLYIPTQMWRSWAYPRSLYLLARSRERLGQLDEARDAVDRLLASWKDADADLPLLAAARELRARIARSPGPRR